MYFYIVEKASKVGQGSFFVARLQRSPVENLKFLDICTVSAPAIIIMVTLKIMAAILCVHFDELSAKNIHSFILEQLHFCLSTK